MKAFDNEEDVKAGQEATRTYIFWVNAISYHYKYVLSIFDEQRDLYFTIRLRRSEEVFLAHWLLQLEGGSGGNLTNFCFRGLWGERQALEVSAKGSVL